LVDAFVEIVRRLDQALEQAAQAMQAEMRKARKQTLYDCGETLERIVRETEAKQTNQGGDDDDLLLQT